MDKKFEIIRRISFSPQGQPFIEFAGSERLWQMHPTQQDVSLYFDTAQRYCTGGYNMSTGESYLCPYQASVDDKYEQCLACMKETGFNPAFYHATTISQQQLERNTQPHIVYLAYFAPGVVKVGISHAGRGLARLLEQGARAAAILLKCNTATIARGYETRITGMYGIRDTVQLNKKAELIKLPFDTDKAMRTLQQLIRQLQDDLRVEFDEPEVQLLDQYYVTGDSVPDLSHAIDLTPSHAIAGSPVGTIGSLLLCRYDDNIIYLPLKKYTGYPVSEAVLPLDIGVQQMTLF